MKKATKNDPKNDKKVVSKPAPTKDSARPAKGKVDPGPEITVGKSGATSAGWHSIESFIRCFKEGQFKHIRKIGKPMVQLPDHFAVGSLHHAARARWFACRFDLSEATWKKIVDAVEAEAHTQRLPVTLKAEQVTLGFFRQYMDYWSKRALPTPLLAEYEIGPAPLEAGDPAMFNRTARLDDVSRYAEGGNDLWIGEAKTGSDSVDSIFNTYFLHGQPILQAVLWKVAPQGEAKHGPVKGVMLDAMQKGYGSDKCKFGRRAIIVPDHVVGWYAKNLKWYLQHVAAIDWDTWVPRNITACVRAVGRGKIECEYRDLCAGGRSATMGYVMGEKGEALQKWQPSPGRTVPPWE